MCLLSNLHRFMSWLLLDFLPTVSNNQAHILILLSARFAKNQVRIRRLETTILHILSESLLIHALPPHQILIPIINLPLHLLVVFRKNWHVKHTLLALVRLNLQIWHCKVLLAATLLNFLVHFYHLRDRGPTCCHGSPRLLLNIRYLNTCILATTCHFNCFGKIFWPSPLHGPYLLRSCNSKRTKWLRVIMLPLPKRLIHIKSHFLRFTNHLPHICQILFHAQNFVKSKNILLTFLFKMFQILV